MEFEFHVRDISKQKIRRLSNKYIKLFKQKQKDPQVIVCALFLELIYAYFDNSKEKLYKLFFPVIMANTVEKGSVHSITEEYRESHQLYSWSYTYRILNKLDEDTGLEISRVFRNILFKILKSAGFKNKGYCVAIDITAKPFYGDKNLLMVKGCERKVGTNYAIQYLTASIIEEGVRFNLLCLPIPSLASVSRKFEALVREIRSMVPIKLFFLDRAFGNKSYSLILKSFKHKFIMPITKNNKLKELEFCMKEQSVLGYDECDIVPLDYVFTENRAKEYQVNVKLLILHDNKGICFFITNMYRLNMDAYYGLTQVYKYRFGIETNYRMDNVFAPFTCSIKETLRYLLMQVSLIVQDLWTLVNFVIHKPEKKQPRELFKGDYSIVEIVTARIKDLGFVWRPKISAVRFKRFINRFLG